MILLPILPVKLEVDEPKLQIGADDFNTWYIDNNMGFIMVKHMHS